jgi:hypothetical protein
MNVANMFLTPPPISIKAGIGKVHKTLLGIFVKLCSLKITYYYETCGLLGYYTASRANCLPTFRDNVSVPSSRVKSPSRKESL